MNHPTPRQKEILKLISEKENLSACDVQKTLGISQATAYREIQKLVQMGLASKIPGGIGKIETASHRCVQCGAGTNSRTAFLIELNDGKQLIACCAHCGLMALANLADIKSAMTTDFLHGTIINARPAWYVLNSDISLCCKPSVLSFASRDDALHFTKGFKGEVSGLLIAQKKVEELMKL
ncbi:MAG: DeoR family transcriptional regulator [Anaerolineales bacterium]